MQQFLTKEEIDVVILGEKESTAYFAVHVDEEKPLLSEGSTFQNVRAAVLSLAQDEAAIVGQALSLLDWHRKCKFCSTCGNKTKPIQGGSKRQCTYIKPGAFTPQDTKFCGIEHYPRTDPVVIMLVISPDGKKCLLGRQKRFPQGVYSCLAGFVESGESIEEGVRRETEEESGIPVADVSYFSSQPWPMGGGQIMIGCFARALSEAIHVDKEELEEAMWVDIETLKQCIQESLMKDSFAKSTKLRIPPPLAIAHKLCAAFVEGLHNLPPVNLNKM